ncbi:MAG TPA: PilZ domain-containing protein [Myxococcales bacterium]
MTARPSLEHARMATDDLPVALIAPAGADADVYRSQLSRRGGQVLAFTSVQAFKEGCAPQLLSGIAMDLSCLALLPDEERAFVAALADSFPLVRLRRVGPPADVAGTYGGAALSGDELLDAFFADVRKRRARRVRLDDRYPLVLGVIVHADERSLDRPGMRASTANLSRGGFYVVTPEIPSRGTCLIVVPKLGDDTPMKCEVRWSTPWGASTQVLPGFGVKILSMTSKQKAAIEKLLEP